MGECFLYGQGGNCELEFLEVEMVESSAQVYAPEPPASKWYECYISDKNVYGVIIYYCPSTFFSIDIDFINKKSSYNSVSVIHNSITKKYKIAIQYTPSDYTAYIILIKSQTIVNKLMISNSFDLDYEEQINSSDMPSSP